MEEGKNPGTYIGDVAADSHLLDQVPYQERKLIRFSLLRENRLGDLQLFRISKRSGKLYTSKMFDAEALCSRSMECFKMVEVAVRKSDSFMKVLEIKVIIQDVNDHSPEFPEKQVNISFSEGDRKGMTKSIPNAIDKDIGAVNSQIDYKLMKKANEPFSLIVSKRIDGTSKLQIKLEDDLDREIKDSYLVHIIAKDGGSPSKQSVLDVHISVTDVNDNSPVFSHNVYNVSIKNTPSTTVPIVLLSAKDFDSGKNGKITYHFSPQTSYMAKSQFKLDKVSGEIFLIKKSLVSQISAYKLYIEAIDEGNPPLSSIAMVLVSVINQQNNAPIIDVNFVSASIGNTSTISEDIAVGSFIAYVKITDDDAGSNGNVNCVLYNDKFQLKKLGAKKYKVIVKNAIDRETEDQHNITIKCQDEGSPPLRSESKFSVQVKDVNDVPPQFSKDVFKFSIAENQAPKSSIGFINVSDPDQGTGGKLSYSLLNKNKQFLPFKIANDGLISTTISLDHEFQDIYEFKVLVEDNGTPSLNNTADVVIEVTDENDNSPYFTFPSVNPYSLDVLYYPHHTKNITILKATDKDSLENAFLSYEIVRGNDNKIFAVNRYSGLLSFNREANQHDAGAHDLQFVVKDSGIPTLSASTNLSLVLTVSNLTSEMFNATHIQLSEKIHQYLLIVIVLVAVTLAVPITAGLSICCIRCNERRKAPRNGRLKISKKKLDQQRHLIVHPHLATAWSEVAIVRSAEANGVRPAQPARQKQAQSSDENLNQTRKSSTLTMKRQKASDIIYQEIDTEDTNEQTQFIIPDVQRELISAHTDSEDGWSDAELKAAQQLKDLSSSDYIEPHSSDKDQISSRCEASSQEPLLFSGEKTLTNRRFNRPNIAYVPDCSQWTDTSHSTMDSGISDIH